MTLPRETLRHIDDAIARFDKALEAVRQIPRQGQQAVTINGIEHELVALGERLRSLRDEVAGENRAE